MKKHLFENHILLAKLQSRLNKNHYLSKDHIPGAADGKIFILLQKENKIPDRKLYPNLYHWYIIVKQFSASTREKWAKQDDKDMLIQQIVTLCQSYQQIDNDTETKQNSSPASETVSSAPQTAFRSAQNFLRLGAVQASSTFILNITFKESIVDNVKEIISRISRERIEVEDFYVLNQSQGTDLVVTIRTREEDCEHLKDVISKWPDITEFLTKQKKFINKAKTMSIS